MKQDLSRKQAYTLQFTSTTGLLLSNNQNYLDSSEKKLIYFFQQMKQEHEHIVYTPLALHITDEYFLNNPSRFDYYFYKSFITVQIAGGIVLNKE